MSIPEHVTDIVTLSATQLSEKYKPTYDSWRNLKQRQNRAGTPVHPDFENFASFLSYMGPRPSLEHTLDRIDNEDPEYAPGKCRWLDKKGQAANRNSTIYLTVDGRTLPLTQYASETGQKPDTLRSRLKKGWSHREVVYGRRTSEHQGKKLPSSNRLFPWLEKEQAEEWERRYKEYRKPYPKDEWDLLQKPIEYFFERTLFNHLENRDYAEILFYKVEALRDDEDRVDEFNELNRKWEEARDLHVRMTKAIKAARVFEKEFRRANRPKPLY